MKQFIKYLLFLIIGIIFYILLNNREKFSIGAPYVERSFNIVSGGDDGIYTYITLYLYYIVFIFFLLGKNRVR